jgi:hypothetical protein
VGRPAAERCSAMLVFPDQVIALTGLTMHDAS